MIAGAVLALAFQAETYITAADAYAAIERHGIAERWEPLYFDDSQIFLTDRQTYARRAQYQTGWFYSHSNDGTYVVWQVEAECRSRTMSVARAISYQYGIPVATSQTSYREPDAAPIPGSYGEMAYNEVCATGSDRAAAEVGATPLPGQPSPVTLPIYPLSGLPVIVPGPPAVAENGTYRGQVSEETGRSRNVYVQGYTRRDGTYVQGHYRSRPRN